jgi:hypothetical protein
VLNTLTVLSEKLAELVVPGFGDLQELECNAAAHPERDQPTVRHRVAQPPFGNTEHPAVRIHRRLELANDDPQVVCGELGCGH